MNKQWMALDETRNCVEIWDAFPQWDNALGKYIRGEGQSRGTLNRDVPHWPKPGGLWECVRRSMHPTAQSYSSEHGGMYSWGGYWWRLVEAHEPHSALGLLVHAARKIENPCDSCRGVCESERETAKCAAAMAYDELQQRLAPFMG
jgi:hypothetical protein